MLTFDPENPHSPGGRAIYQTAVRLSECESWQRVCEKATAEEAFEKIVIGVDYQNVPWDDSKCTLSIDQIKSLFAVAHLHPPDEDESAISTVEKSLVTPLTGGQFMLNIRRIARESEIESGPKRANLYLAFFDEMEALREELATRSMRALCPRLRYVKRSGSPAYSSIEASIAQGDFLWCDFVIVWGDAIGQ